jgi:HEAT repeat protein
MSKLEQYRLALRELGDWEPFLLENSGLPGPRANLELAAAVAEEADAATLRGWAALGPEVAPYGSGAEFLPVCGVIGLGRLLAEGHRSVLAELREHASDPRWRIREAVVIALQRFGDSDLPSLLKAMEEWASGTALERRAAVAALCEPRLLRDLDHTAEVLRLLDRVTAELPSSRERGDDAFRALRQALGYAWSVAIVARPEVGKPLFEHLLENDDPDVRWITRENLRKKRLERMDATWTAELRRGASRR